MTVFENTELINPIGLIQITTKDSKRKELLIDKIIPACCQMAKGRYTLVAPLDRELAATTAKHHGLFVAYTGWEKDMSRKWRQGLGTRYETWIAFLADDILPDENWQQNMQEFLDHHPPGQYGFRLTDENGNRHIHGEDWMQFSNRQLRLNHRPLKYDLETGYIEDSPTAYVANCVVHRKVIAQVEPFGLYRAAPDVMWSFAIRECGFPVGFNMHARAYHLGHRQDNR
jgi:hypothetical protein